jgi:hypothetical protein
MSDAARAQEAVNLLTNFSVVMGATMMAGMSEMFRNMAQGMAGAMSPDTPEAKQEVDAIPKKVDDGLAQFAREFIADRPKIRRQVAADPEKMKELLADREFAAALERVKAADPALPRLTDDLTDEQILSWIDGLLREEPRMVAVVQDLTASVKKAQDVLGPPEEREEE